MLTSWLQQGARVARVLGPAGTLAFFILLGGFGYDQNGECFADIARALVRCVHADAAAFVGS